MLGYGSPEAPRGQLENRGMPDWVVGEESGTSATTNTFRKKRSRRLRDLGPTKEPPPFGSATELFEARLKVLLKIAEQLDHMNEDLHGKYFDRPNIDTSPGYLSQELLSKELWEALRDQHGLDPDKDDFLDTDAVSMLPDGVARSPSEITATLVSV
jgi:hypothetical protein